MVRDYKDDFLILLADIFKCSGCGICVVISVNKLEGNFEEKNEKGNYNNSSI